MEWDVVEFELQTPKGGASLGLGKVAKVGVGGASAASRGAFAPCHETHILCVCAQVAADSLQIEPLVPGEVGGWWGGSACVLSALAGGAVRICDGRSVLLRVRRCTLRHLGSAPASRGGERSQHQLALFVHEI